MGGISGIQKVLIVVMAILAGLMVSDAARAERIKDLASIAGVRSNQLVGYGLVVGLDGSGDQTTQTPFTVQSISNMLANMGITVPTTGTTMQLKNVAAVMVTASLPAFSQPGQQIDVTVSSIGNAKSIRGGTLIMTPLKGADGQVYAMAQGNVTVVGAGASKAGSSVTINHLSAGRIANGATVERAVPTLVGQGEFIHFELHDTDFGTAQRLVEAVNRVSPGSASAVDGRLIRVRAPTASDDRVAFIGRLENLDLRPMQMAAKVIMNQSVKLDACAVAHGNLSVSVNADNAVSQPNAFAAGQTAPVTNAQVEINQEMKAMHNVRTSANLADIVKALNALGANPQDLIAILQAMKASGALRAELEII
jgi:flagellar P-ring protein precursor FlgI